MPTKLQAKTVASYSTAASVTPAVRHECGTLLIASLAAATLTLARMDSAFVVGFLFGDFLFFVAWAWLIHLALRSGRKTWQWPGFLPLALGMGIAAPWLAEICLRPFGLGNPLELIAMVSFQNAGLVTAAYAHHRRCQNFAGILSSFLVLFAVVIDATSQVYVAAGVFGTILLWWLMARYWERIQQTHAASRVELYLPVRASVLGGVLALTILLVIVVGAAPSSAYVLTGFIPSSGGNQWSSEFARSGVGDGDAMVAAKEHALSFGPVESELFLESKMPTLYDMFSETYGEPIKPRKRTERSIGLAPSQVPEPEQRMAKTQRSGREFSILRRSAQRRETRLDNRDAPAMLYVVGRVPLHLALERYDHFDGCNWEHSSEQLPSSPLQISWEGDKPWIEWNSRNAQAIVERHALKIINLKTNRIPSPPGLTSVHIDKVDQLAFFGWTEDGSLAMTARDFIPQLTVVHLSAEQSHPPVTFQGVDVESDPLPNVASCLRLPSGHESMAAAAEDWVRGTPRGWPQVEAIVRRLRADFTHDPEANAPELCENVVEHFLATGRGPDYLFATTAALALRSQGYPTRLVSGFYAQPARYSRRAGQTSVLTEDVHVWVEVCLDEQTWIAIEPTPGYDPPRITLTWLGRIRMLAGDLLGIVRSQWLALLACTVLVVLAWQYRLTWCDWVLGMVFLALGSRSPSARLRATLHWLECRFWLAGSPRPKSATLRRWYSERISLSRDSESRHWNQFLAVAERHLYNPAEPLLADAQQMALLCGAVMRQLHPQQLHSQATVLRAKPPCSTP